MAKIYSKNKQYEGVSAGISFSGGVGETDLPHLLSWFRENGYTVEEAKVVQTMPYKELVSMAKEHGINAVGMKKEELIKVLLEKEE